MGASFEQIQSGVHSLDYHDCCEIRQTKAASELEISKSTMYTWKCVHRMGYFDLIHGTQTPTSAIMSLHEEISQLRAQFKAQDKEIRRLKKENDFLEDTSAFLLLAV